MAITPGMTPCSRLIPALAPESCGDNTHDIAVLNCTADHPGIERHQINRFQMMKARDNRRGAGLLRVLGRRKSLQRATFVPGTTRPHVHRQMKDTVPAAAVALAGN